MNQEEIRSILPDGPVDGHIIEYWRVDSADLKYPVRVVCRYDTNTHWKDHPWGKADEGWPGADFEDDWSIWTEHTPGSPSPSGRLSGWKSLRDYLQDKAVYGTREEAYTVLIRLKEGSVGSLRSRIVSLRADIKRLTRLRGV